MTVQELYNSVAQLGFETALESDDRFVFAVNRAILQVNRIKPATAIYKLNHLPLINKIGEDTFSPVCKKGGAELVFNASAVKSFYFECNGNGQMIIEKTTDGVNWDIIGNTELSSPDGRFIAYKGFIKDTGSFTANAVRMRFLGDYLYYVQNVAMYEDVVSNNVEDISGYSKYVKYHIASRVSDFMSFAVPPIADAERNAGFVFNVDYFVDGENNLCIPASASGVFDICYKRRPNAVSIDDLTNLTDIKNIDLSDELCAILPNLVASYLWVDDEPDKAQYYLSLYREQVAEIEAKAKDLRPFVYRNKTGW